MTNDITKSSNQPSSSSIADQSLSRTQSDLWQRSGLSLKADTNLKETSTGQNGKTDEDPQREKYRSKGCRTTSSPLKPSTFVKSLPQAAANDLSSTRIHLSWECVSLGATSLPWAAGAFGWRSLISLSSDSDLVVHWLLLKKGFQHMIPRAGWLLLVCQMYEVSHPMRGSCLVHWTPFLHFCINQLFKQNNFSGSRNLICQ